MARNWKVSQFLKEFTDQKRDEKMYKKSSDISVYNTINREEVRELKSSLVHYTLKIKLKAESPCVYFCQ